MASDIFAKIGDIKGESLDDKHKDEIDVLSFSWGLTQSGSAAGGGGGAGKVQFQDFHFTKRTDRSSPLLFLGCATGEQYKEGVIIARKAGERPVEYLQIKMNDIIITSYQTGGSSADDKPIDQISLNFAKIEFVYRRQDETGKVEETKAGWDLKANKKA